MVNNIAKTTQKLSTQLGETTSFESSESMTLITGEIGTGLLLFDPDGTLGVISYFENETSFTVMTCALSIDVNSILNLSY